ncbi:Glycosyltransferase involved in cell wall bisynthesis [Azotobacter beijerinckii]|uniref:Glycosyltransferase involved in cell wall bisynthesis n=1 Tax=Azotobacter beijerinckii TaxID=170623 RepID=A0A1H6Y1M7_9GAMM|nr:glycosyltransferase [Azotobacter beijerinckii]SEJ31020.1 Glycosyltransferase involved in cell wall bisynthesis [Azotobacter beijerinckii]
MPRIALYTPSFAGGGTERVMLYLAEGFIAHGHQVDLVVNEAEGAFRDQVPDGARIVKLDPARPLGGRLLILSASSWSDWKALARPVLFADKPDRQFPYLASLARYLRAQRPDALIAANSYCNLTALWAKRLARVSTRIMVTEHNSLSFKILQKSVKGAARWRALLPLIGRVYSRADAVVAVSNGVADDLSAITGLPRGRIATIYNPVITPELAARAREPAPHPWLTARDGIPVIVAAGRLAPQKNFPLLLQAFALLRRQRPARLLILGEGRQRAQLEALIGELGIGGDLALPGFVSNPYAAFSRAALFVLSSDFEGLGNALIEAMACGCPVVSTDCPSGPAEILEGGRFGELVPPNDAEALSAAMRRALDAPVAAEVLRRRGADFTLERSVEQYLALLFANRQPREAAGWRSSGGALGDHR